MFKLTSCPIYRKNPRVWPIVKKCRFTTKEIRAGPSVGACVAHETFSHYENTSRTAKTRTDGVEKPVRSDGGVPGCTYTFLMIQFFFIHV